MLAWILVFAPEPARADEDVRPPRLRPTLVFETGLAYVAQNDGRYGATGTAFEAKDVGQQDNLARVSRASIEVASGRHTAILLYAPFQLTTVVTLDSDLQFRDQLFAAGSVVQHRYLFDGYRASYLYRVLDRARVKLEIGGSLQIRNADVAFTSGDGTRQANQSDIGLVFAAKARLWWKPNRDRGAWAALEADALSTFGLIDGVSGGIYDLGLAVGHPIGRGVDLMLVTRLLGGGATVESQNIDNWANFISFTAGARISLDRLLSSAGDR
ncbi:MAG: hypothetical protein JNL83_32330 [Myxococcales bacterium]|nr:hypothetical protein [Myxococcales bacterium]